ncbi:TERF1-interacting nuclear factor 2 isoform X2 [Catharus ustulatus]|uniref:TERF1-interacting nuclear factor 2 isoform X2 n=1 Tax=Catharus ustulatus TaxID=91951 RepID=UPI00140AC81C|nr:TERF1-interacting nuclear factor 2 isoform X2 [Catharus ustulatus]
MAGSDVSPSPSLRLAMAGAWWALRGRGLTHGGRGLDGRGWGRLLALLEAVGGGAPGLLRPRHRARLSLGLRAQVVTSLLQELGPAPAVLDALDWLFPEGAGPGSGHALGEYGPRFQNSLRNLFLEFLRRLESALPPPDLAQLEQLCRSHAPPGTKPRPLPILRLYLSEVGHAHPEPVPRPLPARKATPPTKHRPLRRRLRPLRFSPYHADGEGDRDRHRAHGQGGADQGARGGEGGDPPPAAAADLQREADE